MSKNGVQTRNAFPREVVRARATIEMHHIFSELCSIWELKTYPKRLIWIFFFFFILRRMGKHKALDLDNNKTAI